MNFMRGNQMVVHDPRLNNPGNPTATPPVAASALRPPGAKQTWTVQLSDTAAHITDWTAKVATDWSTMDALHFMAHGNQGYLQIGADGFRSSNINLFEKYKGHVKNIVFFACLVGSDLGNAAACGLESRIYAQQVAQKAGARVIACNVNQIYSWGAAGVIDFGAFEGDVYVIEADGCNFQIYSASSGNALNLENLIFN
ncbi:MAG: DUF4347 domain-containing protein [Acidobacteriota bacterium]|nr:DUF4347 domain-containing protein [Acidobacteriota bacterium]